MARKSFLMICAAGLLALTSIAGAQTIVLLKDDSVKRLDPKAADNYRQGAEAYDKVDFDTALNKFNEAMKTDPGQVQLRFLVARFAHERGKMRTGEEALRLFTMSQEALTGLKDIPTLKPEDKKRAERDLKAVEADIDENAKRDARRETVGRQIVMEIIKERKDQEKGSLKPLGLKDKTKETMPGMAAGKGKPGAAPMAGGAAPMGANKNPYAMSNYYNTGNMRR